MDEQRSTWLSAYVEKNVLEDEIEIVQYGIEDEFEFYRVNYATSGPSYMNKWPTKEEPDNKYKFASVWFELSQDESKIER